MSRSKGVLKRPASFVPRPMWAELNRLSKADLMDIAYQLALRIDGEESEICAYAIVKNEHEVLCGNEQRRPVKLKVMS